MKNDWILDVLTDLKSFAHMNSLPQLADRLSDVADLAALELASAEGKACSVHGHRHASRENLGKARAG